MTLCIVSDSYPPHSPFGGIGVYTQTAARALAARGHRVHVLIGDRARNFDDRDGSIQIHFRKVGWLPLLGRFAPALGEGWALAKAVRALHRAHRFDLVEFPNFEGIGLVTQMLVPVPVVVRLHTSMVEAVEVQSRPPRLGERFMMWAEKQSARRAAGVVTHSRAHRDRLAAVYGLTNVHVIPHGTTLPTLRPVEPAAPALLTLGRLNARKGGPALLAAIPRVLAAVPEATWTVVGASDTHPLVERFRTAHPSLPRERVVFHEFLDGAALTALWDAAALYLSASIYESFGLTFVEAMARGIPVVGCATSAMNEIIAPEITGLLVPPNDAPALADAALRLLRDAALRQRLGAEGRRVAEEKYTPERMGAAIEAWYAEVLRS